MKFTKRLFSSLLAILMLTGCLTVVLPASATDESFTYGGTVITDHKGGYEHYDRTVVEHKYDFSMERLGFYAVDTALALGNRASAEIVDGRLQVKEGLEFNFGSAICVGDDYGLEEGYLSFKLKLTGGKTLLGMRTSKTNCLTYDRGIWFEFDGSDKMKIYEPECELEATVDTPVSLARETVISVHDEGEKITLSAGETVVAVIKYSDKGYLAFCRPDESVVAETDKCRLYPTGYFQITLDDLRGYIDDVVFTNVEHKRNIEKADEPRPIDYSTWTATDAIDRTTATSAEATAPKDNRYVGVFYFLCWVGAGGVVSDNTKDYLEYGGEHIKDRIEERGGEAYWAEPYFGYYRNTDTWVYRKHAYMLEAAGVDFIYLDVSNGVVFEEGHMALFDTWLEMRREGIDTPQIVFFNGDNTKYMESNMEKLFTTVYSDGNWSKYEELFFLWEGKPLIFGNISGVSASLKAKINEKFTVRGNWAWKDQNGYWSWLQEYKSNRRAFELVNGGWGRDANGNKESLSVAMGHHPATSKGRSFVDNVQPNNGLRDFEFSSVERAGQGLCFEFQFEAMQWLIERNIKATDPFVLLITGWNEWIAGGYYEGKEVSFANGTSRVTYVDQFNVEFSRDGEPMRNVDGYGIGDNYYYQMVDYIRKYKGIGETPVADNQTSVNIYDVSSWDNIELKYLDNLYDTELRNSISYDAHYRYINNTGRNDFDYAKVSQDDNALYFLIKTSHDIVVDSDENWMNLYINIDGDHATGWEGYDYVLNRSRDSFVVSVDKFTDNTYKTETVGGAYYYLGGEYMAIRLSKDIVGVDGAVEKMIFKWADNADVEGDPMAFMDRGDSAPDNRFGYLYLCNDYQTVEIPATKLSEAGREMTQKIYSVNKPAADVDISIEDLKVDVKFDIDEFSSGKKMQNTPMGEYFEYSGGDANSKALVAKQSDGNVIRAQGFSDIRTWSDVEGSYEFSADVKLTSYGNTAVYMRGEMPGAYAPTNPKNHNVKQVFNYYEWDWYAENGGTTFGSSSTAGSGIGIYPGEKNITIRVKRYAKDGLGVASASHTFPYTDEFSPNESGWLNIHCVDNGEELKIYFNNALMCSIKLQNPGVSYESDGTGQQYYGTVILCDAEGTEVLTVENTRVNSQGSQIAFTTRAQTIDIKNIHICYDSQSAEGSQTRSEMAVTEKTAVCEADSSLMTTLNLGTDKVGPERETESDSTEMTSPEETTTPEDETVSEPRGKGCKSATGTAAVSLLALVGACAFFKKKNKNFVGR